MSRKKPGPKGLLKNPRPLEVFGYDGGHEVSLGTTDEVGPHELVYAERGLRSYFSKHSKELVPRAREEFDAAVSRIIRLAVTALSEAPVWWSGYEREQVVDNPAAFERPGTKSMKRQREEMLTLLAKERQPREFEKLRRRDPKTFDRPWNPPSLRRASRPWGKGGARRYVGPKPPAKAEDKCLWLDTSPTPAMLKRYDRASKSWRDVLEVDESIAADKITAERFVADMTRPVLWRLGTSWPRAQLGLRDPVAQMLRGRMGRAGKSGRPAYLASATLGVLLDTTPEKIADLLNSYRRHLVVAGIHR